MRCLLTACANVPLDKSALSFQKRGHLQPGIMDCLVCSVSRRLIVPFMVSGLAFSCKGPKQSWYQILLLCNLYLQRTVHTSTPEQAGLFTESGRVGRVVTFSFDTQVRVWLLDVPEMPHDRLSSAVAYSFLQHIGSGLCLNPTRSSMQTIDCGQPDWRNYTHDILSFFPNGYQC